MNSTTATAGGGALRTHLVNALPWSWLGISVAWAVVIFTADQPAWPLALWIATTVGPLIALKTRLDAQVGPRED
jgi:hypothetical protein